MAKKTINIDTDVLEPISESKKKIESLQFGIQELSKRISIDTYEEFAEILKNGDAEKYINIGDELMVNKLSRLTFETNNSSLKVSATDEYLFAKQVGRVDDDVYVLRYAGGKWTYLESAINIEDFGLSVSGTPVESDLIKVKMSYTVLSHTFTDFDSTGENAIHPKDENVKHFAVIEQTYVPDAAFNFDAPESAICITPGYTLPAGKYYVYYVAGATGDYWCNYKRLYYAFEILNDIKATESTGDIQLRYSSRGDRETTGDARGVYILNCKPYCCNDDSLYNSDTITFTGQVNKPSEEYTDLRTVSGFSVNQSMESVGIIYNNLGHVCYGNNEWNVSNLRQRINSFEKEIVPERMHKNDIVTGLKKQKGIAWGLDPRFVELIKPCIVSIQHGLNDEFTTYQLYTCEDFATLLSMKEMSFNYQTNEGVVTKLYSKYTDGQLANNAVASRAKSRESGKNPQDFRWSRSVGAGSSSSARLVSPSGSVDGNGAGYGYRFAPAYILGVANHPESEKSVEA